MKNMLLFLLVALAAFASHAQDKKDLEFVVVKPKVVVAVWPRYDFLFQHAQTEVKIELKNADPDRTYRYELAGGEVEQRDSLWLLMPIVNRNVYLNIYEMNGTQENLVFSLPYQVKPEPKPFLGNVGSDSVLVDMLLIPGRLTARSEGVRGELPVSSFEAFYVLKGESRVVEVKGDRLPRDVRIELTQLPQGALITYSKIRVELWEGFGAYIASYRVTMDKMDSKSILGY